uniref:Uncharacterized protein n=1 Tax=Oryza rufipogon TaxID=4529 RepID=A0A0E0P5N2_ORYRU
MRRRGSNATSLNSWRPPHMATISAMSESLRFTNATDRLNSGCNARVTWEMAPRETLAASRSGSPWSAHDEVSLGDHRWVPRDKLIDEALSRWETWDESNWNQLVRLEGRAQAFCGQ